MVTQCLMKEMEVCFHLEGISFVQHARPGSEPKEASNISQRYILNKNKKIQIPPTETKRRNQWQK